MAVAIKTYTFTAGTTASAAEVNKNFDDILGFLNGGDVIHADGSKPFTGYPLLPTAAPSNARHPVRKQDLDASLTAKLVAFQSIGHPSIFSIGTSPAAAYNFPTKTFVVDAADVSAARPFVFNAMVPIVPAVGPPPNVYNLVIEFTIDGTVETQCHTELNETRPQAFFASGMYVPTTASTKTVRMRMWCGAAGTVTHTTYNKGGFWGVWRTAA